MSRSSPRLLLLPALAVSLGLMSSAASAAPGLALHRISPVSGPQLASTTVTLHGSGFSTTPGATQVSFGSEAALSVSCSSSRLCVASTPFVFATGPVPVTVTVGASTSGSQTFTYVPFSPPVVNIVTAHMSHQAQFSRKRLKDFYPAVFDVGNVYLEITNTTAATQEVTGNGPNFTLPAGETEGLNMPATEVPYTFTLTGSTAAKATLTVTTVK
jgi:hypothetical protein